MKCVRGKYSAHDERERNINDTVKDKGIKDEKVQDAAEIEKRINVESEKLQWHPAFFADVQIEFEEERHNLIFENEHQLGTKPKEIDILIIKKNRNIPVRKNIGRNYQRKKISG